MSEVYHEVAFFTGHVQGVGFRATALAVAKEFEVSGWVKNLADGRVQLEAEGRKSEVTTYLKTLEERMHGYIRKVERTAQMRPAEHVGFQLR